MHSYSNYYINRLGLAGLVIITLYPARPRSARHSTVEYAPDENPVPRLRKDEIPSGTQFTKRRAWERRCTGDGVPAASAAAGAAGGGTAGTRGATCPTPLIVLLVRPIIQHAALGSYSRVKSVPEDISSCRDHSTGWRCHSTGAGGAILYQSFC